MTTTEISSSSLEYLKSIYFDATSSIRHYDGQRAIFTQIFASLLTIFTSIVTAASIQGIAITLLPIAAIFMTLLSITCSRKI